MEAYNLTGRNYDDSNLQRIQEYLAIGGDPDFQLYDGVTVFMEAVGFPSDNIRVIRELINAGADVNLRTHRRCTPLILAVCLRKRRVFQLLMESGASVNAKDFLGQTVLHHAILEWSLHLPETSIQFPPDMWIIDKLLQQEDLDCNQTDLIGRTPLMAAVMDKQIESVSLLLRKNVNPNIGNELSVTPLHLAYIHLDDCVGKLLLYYGASIYSVDKNGQTPVDVLLQIGLDIHKKRTVINILKDIAFKCYITSDLNRKFQLFPHYSLIFSQYCQEVDHMIGDFIYGKITMHDFVCDSFSESYPDFQNIHEQQNYILQIHKAAVERLVKNIYPGYFNDIIVQIPKSSLEQILQIVALRKRRVGDIAYLFSISHINELISMHLTHDKIFELICIFW